LLLVIALLFDRASPHLAQPSAAAAVGPLADLIWIAVPGLGGGGGGGGNQRPDPPQRLQRPGRDRISVPPILTTSLEPASDLTPAEPVEQPIELPVLPLAAAAVLLPGAIDGNSPAISLGSGQRAGAGTGRGDGDGPGDGDGRGPGSRGNEGGGLNAPGARVIFPVVLRDVKPRYTAEAMRARIQGSVLVSAVVQADGTVSRAQVIRSLDPVFGLDEAAVQAARQWLFRPGTIAGKPVAVAVTIELSFNLR
jgi:protein TonB